MKEITLSRKSWHYRLYNSTFENTWDEPQSLCIYFWRVVLSVLILVPTLPGHIINLVARKVVVPAWSSIAVMIFLILLGAPLSQKFLVTTGWGFWLKFITAIGLGAVGWFLILGTIALICLGIDRYETKRSALSKKTLWDNITQKYCSKIKWK